MTSVALMFPTTLTNTLNMAADRLSSDWVEAEIAHQLELVSIELEDDNDGEADGEESTPTQVHTLHWSHTSRCRGNGQRIHIHVL